MKERSIGSASAVILGAALLLTNLVNKPLEFSGVPAQQSVYSTNGLEKVRSEFSKIPKEDQVLIYKMVAGGADYLKNAQSLSSTSQFDPVLARVQTSYSWDREKYPSFTDAVSEYLISSGYEEPKELSSREDRLKFSKIFEDLEAALK